VCHELFLSLRLSLSLFRNIDCHISSGSGLPLNLFTYERQHRARLSYPLHSTPLKEYPLQEKELIQRCNANDRVAQRLLYERFAPLLMAICRRYVGQQQAEDVVQDSFIRIFQYLVQYRQEGSFEGWIRRVCVSTCIRHLEKAKRLQVDYQSDDMPESAVAPTVVDQMSANELLVLIDKLPDGYRAVFNLSVIEGYPHKDIASMLGIEESSSRSQLTKARKFIQRSMNANFKVVL
jgi:RNA polymerase sigma factor (sigma-70 family)